jgi:hypothetical protein
VAESTALIVKMFSGTISDYLGRRKGLTRTGLRIGRHFEADLRCTGCWWHASWTGSAKEYAELPRGALVADV